MAKTKWTTWLATRRRYYGSKPSNSSNLSEIATNEDSYEYNY
jgi:hypothetical protein